MSDDVSDDDLAKTVGRRRLGILEVLALQESRISRETHGIGELVRSSGTPRSASGSLAARRHEAVDPTKRLVARELESRWNTALERVADLEARIARHDKAASLRPEVNMAALMALARDLPTVWNASGTEARTRQRITHILIREVIIDLDDATNVITPSRKAKRIHPASTTGVDLAWSLG